MNALEGCGAKPKDRNPPGRTASLGRIFPFLPRTTFKSALLARGDLLLSVDGKLVNAFELKEFITSKKPGDTVTLRVRRTEADPNTAIAAPVKGMKEDTIQIRVSAREIWCGPAELAGPAVTAEPASPFTGQTVAATFADDPLVKGGKAASEYIQRRVVQFALREPVDKRNCQNRWIFKIPKKP